MRRARGLLATVLLLAAARAGADPAWDASFPPWSLGNCVPAGGTVAVAAGGMGAEDAAHAVRQGLRESGMPALVLRGSALGNVSSLADEDVVRRAEGLFAGTVVVVRVFDGPSRSPVASARFYDASGRLVYDMTVARGQVAAPCAAPPQVAVPAPPQPPPPLSSPVEPPRGDRAAFYFSVGRPDLVTAYRHRERVRAALLGSGAGALVAGTALFIAGVLDAKLGAHCLEQNLHGDCIVADHKPQDILMGVGGGLGLVGTGLLIAGAIFRATPTSALEDQHLIDHARDGQVSWRLRLSPTVASTGAGVRAAFDF